MSGDVGRFERLKMLFPAYRRMVRLERRIEELQAALLAAIGQKTADVENLVDQVRAEDHAARESANQKQLDAIRDRTDVLSASLAQGNKVLTEQIGAVADQIERVHGESRAARESALQGQADTIRKYAESLAASLTQGNKSLAEQMERARVEGHAERMATAENIEKCLLTLREDTSAALTEKFGAVADKIAAVMDQIEHGRGEDRIARESALQGQTDTIRKYAESLSTSLAQGNESLAGMIERVCIEGHAERMATAENTEKLLLLLREDASAALNRVTVGVAAEAGRLSSGIENRINGAAADVAKGLARISDALDGAQAGLKDEIAETGKSLRAEIGKAHEGVSGELASVAGRVDAAAAVVAERVTGLERREEALSQLVERVRVEGHAERVATAENYQKFLEQLQVQARSESQRIVTDLFRNDIRCRWQILDALDGLLFPPGTVATCPICGYSAERSTYALKVSDCIFGGGRLERYVCPECGAIFGPLKTMSLTEEQMAAEYRQSYSVYSESDCTMLERLAFEALHPEKGKTYLNYGAGAWNKTTKELRAEGYDVYDYEPYAPVEANPWIIRSFDELAKRRFDGIFSNDVIEHLRNPIVDLKAMKRLLKRGAEMAHCSGCYEYAFEYTRFHLFFLTGDSLVKLSDAIGMKFELSDRLFEGSPARLCKFSRAKRNM